MVEESLGPGESWAEASGPDAIRKLVLLRHGQSHYNREKIFTGWADPDLTNRGRDEARLAGSLLKAFGITKVLP